MFPIVHAILKNEHKWKDTPWLWYDEEKQMAKIHSIMSLDMALTIDMNGKRTRQIWSRSQNLHYRML